MAFVSHAPGAVMTQVDQQRDVSGTVFRQSVNSHERG